MRPKLAEDLGTVTPFVSSMCAPQKLLTLFSVAFAMCSLLKALFFS